MKKIIFKCKNKDSEIRSIVICILLFVTGWLISSVIARNVRNSVLITVFIPLAFLVCGVVYMSRCKKAPQSDGIAQFSDSGRVKLTFGGRSVIFDCKDIKNLHYTRDTLTNDAIGNGYIMIIKLPYKSYKLFSEAVLQGEEGFESTELYAVYLELKARMVKSDEQSE